MFALRPLVPTSSLMRALERILFIVHERIANKAKPSDRDLRIASH
jgi:hypothetical protein